MSMMLDMDCLTLLKVSTTMHTTYLKSFQNFFVKYTDKRTEWSPVRTVIIGRPIC